MGQCVKVLMTSLTTFDAQPVTALTWSELTVMGSFSSNHTMHSSQGGVVKEPW